MGTVSQRSRISETSSRYSSRPMHHSAVAKGASNPDCEGHAGTRTDAVSARDCVLTTHSSQVPLTPRTESCVRTSSRLAGTP